jgi:hypothetical protein
MEHARAAMSKRVGRRNARRLINIEITANTKTIDKSSGLRRNEDPDRPAAHDAAGKLEFKVKLISLRHYCNTSAVSI